MEFIIESMKCLTTLKEEHNFIMDLIEIYEKILETEPGSRYYKIDFHIHSPMTGDWKGDEISLEEWLNKLKELGYDIIIIADHGLNSINFIEEYNKISNKKDYPKIFFGSEVQSKDFIHLHFIFENSINPTECKKILDGYRITEDELSEIENNVDNILINQINNDKILLLLPHANISKGLIKVKQGHSTDFLKNVKSRFINLPPEELKYKIIEDHTIPEIEIPSCSLINHINRKDNNGFPIFLNSIKETLSIVKISDAHSVEEIENINSNCFECLYYKYCFKGANWVKLGEFSIKALKQLHYDSQNRIHYNEPKPPSHPYLIGIHINNGFFENNFFHFNPWLNILMGGRGTGKSLIIEIIKCMILEDLDSFFENNILLEHKLVCNLPKNTKIRLFFKDQDQNIWLIERWVEDAKKEKDQRKSKISFSKRKFYKLNDTGAQDFYEIKEGFPILDELISIKCQAEITDLAKKKNFSIGFLDNYIEEKTEWSNLEKLFSNFKIEEQFIINQSSDLVKNLDDISNYYKIWEEYEKIIENIKNETSISSEINSLIDMKNQWTNGNEIFNYVDHVISNFNSYNNLSFWNLQNNWPKDFDSLFNSLKDTYLDVITKINGKQADILNEINRYKDSFTKLKDIWSSSYNYKIDEIDKQINNLGQSSLNELDNRKKDLENEIKSFGNLSSKIRKNKKIIKNHFKKLKELNIEINKKHIVIQQLRKKKAGELSNILGAKYSINVKQKDSKDLERYLKEEYGKRLIIDDLILSLGPNSLFSKFIGDNSLQNINPNSNRNKIYDDLRKSVNKKFIKDSKDPDFTVRWLEKRKLKLFDESILNIPLLSFDDKLDIRLKKGMQFRPLEEGSMGEIIGTLLNILLQVKYQTLIVDQPDAELDFDSLKILIEIILKMKPIKQILFATHNPNLPSLGDADQIFFLDQIITDLQDGNIKQRGIIKKCGAFEKMIDMILNLEGGEDAIRKRMEKYLLT